ncbi:cadmium transporter [Rhizocola hellebori]|uniref:Cadmium transporter n=1 Tax=Rhizocola hellebori TaxID=1392758 RepID=A0A8J3VL81_9ACTN|nr:cadmium resistance transporter [Rhizocola hellebori]GIH10585.1 cadmium transporter [Rhizocola hellebori]
MALGAVAAAIGVFAGTNVDDIIVLAVLFTSARAMGVPKAWQIWAGQYTGIAVLVAVSVAVAAGLAVVPDRWVGLLGLIPLGLGVRGLIRAIRARGEQEPEPVKVATGVVSVAAVTIANGADNISVYTPLFRTIGVADTVITIGVFAVLVAVWCVAGSWLGSHRRVVAVIERFGHWIVPIVFILLGGTILLRAA